jgi:hypothetical protein
MIGVNRFNNLIYWFREEGTRYKAQEGQAFAKAGEDQVSTRLQIKVVTFNCLYLYLCIYRVLLTLLPRTPPLYLQP